MTSNGRRKLTIGSTFSGIGGFELGLEATGRFETKWQCEISEYPEPLQQEFQFGYDACPFPRPAGFDGLKEEWGSPAWVNPPWEAGSAGPTAWTRKCIAEAQKGKDVVMIFPQDKWVLELINAGAEIRPMPTFRWLNPEGERQPKAPGRGHALFILRGRSVA